MKKLILPFVLGAMLISCSRDNDDVAATPNPENPTTATETPVLLTKLVNVEEDGSIETTHFEYDGDKLTKIYGGYESGSWSHESVITYTGDLITSIKGKTSNNEGEETIFDYDEQNRLKTVTETIKGSSATYTNTRHYTHNVDGTVVVREVKKTDYINASLSDTEKEKTMTYTVVNGLITKIEYNENGSISTEFYTYDDKNGSFKNIRGIKEVMFEFVDDVITTGVVHNVTSITQGADIDTYTYEYNDKNYPKKVTATNTLGDSETYEYFYNK